jgi:aspartate racemase
MKTANPQLLGVLGGMGPMATVDFLAKLIKATPASCDQDHIPIIAHFVPQIPDRSDAIEGIGLSPQIALENAALKIEREGAFGMNKLQVV